MSFFGQENEGLMEIDIDQNEIGKIEVPNEKIDYCPTKYEVVKCIKQIKEFAISNESSLLPFIQSLEDKFCDFQMKQRTNIRQRRLSEYFK